jgi:hypothetical protein
VTVVGVVGSGISIENDGDFVFYVKPTQENSSLLAIGNYILFGGQIHPEVVPADQQKVLGPVGGGVCPGDKVKITGVLALDTDHGMYSEIHPVNIIQKISSAGSWPSCLLGQAGTAGY